MLTQEQKNKNEIRYLELLSLLKVDLTNFNKHLNEVHFFDQPLTAQAYRSYPGGLCEHALAVAHELGVLCNAYCPGQFTEEDVLKVALLKDLYRATMYEVYSKNIKDETTGNWISVPAYKVKDGANRPVFGDLHFSSYMIAKQFFDFTEEQIEAIVYCKPSDFTADIYDVMRQHPLVTLTRMAEMAASFLN